MSKGWQVRWYILFALVPLVLLVNGVLAAVAGIDWAALGQALALLLFLGGVFLLYRDSRRELEQQQVILRVSEGLLARLELGELLDYIVDAILQWVPLANKCVIHLLDEQGRRLYPRYSSQPDWQRILGMPANKGIAGQALQELRTQVVDDVRKSPEFLPLQSSSELRSLMVAPLHAQGKPLGTISLNSSAPRAFTERDRALVSMLAAQASAAIVQSQLYSAALRETYHVETILNNLADGVVFLDARNRILRHNLAFVQLLHLDQQDLLGRRIDAHSPDMALRRLALLIAQDSQHQEAQQTGMPQQSQGGNTIPASYERRLELAGPARTLLDVYVSPVKDPDRQWGRVIILRDRTQDLSQKQTLSELIQAAARELSVPATTVRGYATLMENSPATNEQEAQRWARAIGKHSTRMARLSEDLADLAAVNGAGLPILTEPVNLNELLTDVVDELAPLAAQNGLSIHVQCPPNLPPIPLDHDRLRRVFLHLLENSIQRTSATNPDNGSAITVQVEATLEELTVTIADDGAPLSDQARAWLFGNSYLLDGADESSPSASHDTTEVGLGLYISRKIIEAHLGHLWIPEHDRNKFQFIVPVQWSTEESNEPAITSAP
ncbi:MAG: GAF domain-containing sensor histidine kinase [Chloroflexi bacterium]|nr:GAF domain-containing sensor histidine kinase [Chloroflexota bacterium]